MISKIRNIGCIFFLSFYSHAYDFIKAKNYPLKIKTEINIRKSGPYIGIQRGKYTILEMGGELQWKKVKLIKPFTNAVHVGFNYNFKYNVLGYDAGYWFKTGRLNLTYGANVCFRTDFTYNSIGVAPVIGFKFTQFHLQTGYHFLTSTSHYIQTNTFFISLRFVMVNNRDIDCD